ncbi:phage tail assembly chaperone [Herbaspirillum sp. SJZ107]|uniref:phage tail assembly chaperone n=1 Tax=Herbaspirillum sp. SJZ107 TaxID=2572881 RepID=UPI00114D9D9F|nr:phage tail assembly chaperone [Herbaspirillum sp. SJZ107]TQK10254.1 tail assembly chaperone [Herbaspirillum sp. SJZ107]
MAKISLDPNPTFKAKAPIHVPGGRKAEIEFKFKYRDADEFKDFTEKLEGRSDVDILMDIAVDWDLDEAFDKQSVEKLTKKYIGSARSVLNTYVDELTGARAKN